MVWAQTTVCAECCGESQRRGGGLHCTSLMPQTLPGSSSAPQTLTAAGASRTVRGGDVPCGACARGPHIAGVLGAAATAHAPAPPAPRSSAPPPSTPADARGPPEPNRRRRKMPRRRPQRRRRRGRSSKVALLLRLPPLRVAQAPPLAPPRGARRSHSPVGARGGALERRCRGGRPSPPPPAPRAPCCPSPPPPAPARAREGNPGGGRAARGAACPPAASRGESRAAENQGASEHPLSTAAKKAAPTPPPLVKSKRHHCPSTFYFHVIKSRMVPGHSNVEKGV